MNHSISLRHSKTNDVAGSIHLADMTSVYKLNEIRKKRDSSGDGRKKSNERQGQSQGQSQGLGEGRMFVIKSSKQSLCLMAKCQEECDRWVRGIQLQLDLEKKKKKKNQEKSSSNRRSSGNKFDKYESILKDLEDDCLPIKVGRGVVPSGCCSRADISMLDDLFKGAAVDHNVGQNLHSDDYKDIEQMYTYTSVL